MHDFIGDLELFYVMDKRYFINFRICSCWHLRHHKDK